MSAATATRTTDKTEKTSHWLHELAEVLVFSELKDFVRDLFKKWREQTLDPAAGHLAEWTLAKLFGLKTEDERRYNAALALLDPNESDRLVQRLGRLTPEQSDYYRITILQDTPAKMAQIMAQHAQMPEDVWDAHCRNMNLCMQHANKQFHVFMAWAGKYIQELYKQVDAYLNACADQWRADAQAMQAARLRRNSNAFKIVFYGFARALAIPGVPSRRTAMSNTTDNGTTNRDNQATNRPNDCNDNNPRRGKLGFSFCFRGVEFHFTGINVDAALYRQRAKKDAADDTVNTNPAPATGVTR